jgi:tetratricopeptide (TPR) repeat protein
VFIIQNLIRMKKLFVLFTFLGIFSFAKAQDVSALIAEGQRLESILDEVNALNKFKEALKIAPQNVVALCRSSELCSSIGNKESSTKSRDAYFNTALSYAQSALKLHPESDLSNIAMAIAVGRIVLTKSGKEKIASVKELKAYAEKAIKVNPSNFKGWHILGKWHYEVANLSSFERGAAKLLFGALPAASFSNAILCYEKARTLSPGFLLNLLELARVYKKTSEKVKAKNILTILQGFKNSSPDDAKIKIEAKVMLDKL